MRALNATPIEVVAAVSSVSGVVLPGHRVQAAMALTQAIRHATETGERPADLRID